MNVQTIASVHIHHLRELIRANPQNSRELRNMVTDLLDEFIRPVTRPTSTVSGISSVTAPSTASIVDLTEDITVHRFQNVSQMAEFVFSPNVTIREVPTRTMNNDTGIVELTMRPPIREQIIGEHVRMERERLQRNAERAERSRKCVRKESRAYGAARLNQPSDEECGVCLEKPALKNMTKTVCGHSFCIACFDQWEQHCVNVGHCANCPTCRRRKPSLTMYVPRAPNANTGAVRA